MSLINHSLSFQAYEKNQEALETYLKSQGITQLTVQPEFPELDWDDTSVDSKDCCFINCHSDWCKERKCCNENHIVKQRG